jgi:hypothetical protein
MIAPSTKKHGSTSDRSCAGTFNIAHLVSRLDTPLMPRGHTVDRVHSWPTRIGQADQGRVASSPMVELEVSRPLGSHQV